MWSLFPGLGLQDVRWVKSLGFPGLKLARSSLVRQSCHPHPYPNESMQLRQVTFKVYLCGASSAAIMWDAGGLGNLDEHGQGHQLDFRGPSGFQLVAFTTKPSFPSQYLSSSTIIESKSSLSLHVFPFVLICFLANPVATMSLHKRRFVCASSTPNTSYLVVHGMLQLRRFFSFMAPQCLLTCSAPFCLVSMMDIGSSVLSWLASVLSFCWVSFLLACCKLGWS